MYHCKVLIVDEYFVSVGSTNFDDRSFKLNDEANLNVFNNKFAKEQIETFEDDRNKSKKISYEEWKNRSWKEKALEKFNSILRSQY